MATRTVTSLPVTELPVADGNWDLSRKTIDKIIIHTMVGTIASANARFNNPDSQVSAHYGVGLDGHLVHWVDETNTAYHAGDYIVNQSSIGIEHEDNGDYNGVRPDILYTSSAALVRDIANFYQIPIDRDHIKKHLEVSDNPTSCPDALDIDRIVREAQGKDTTVLPEQDFQNCFITQADRWPTAAEETSWKASGDTPYHWVQVNAPNPAVDTAKTNQKAIDSIASQESVRQAVEAATAPLQAQINKLTTNPKVVTKTVNVAVPLSTYNVGTLFSALIKKIFKGGGN